MSSDLEEKNSHLGSSTEHVDEKAAGQFADEMKGLDLTEIQSHAEHFTLEEAKALIEETVKEHINDPNFDPVLIKRAQAALQSVDLSHDVARALVEEIKLEAALMDDSPYLEVRAVVDNFDDPTLPVNTFRAWFIGVIFTVIGTGVNTFFAARNPAITLNTFCAQVLAYPIGKAFEKFLPGGHMTIMGRRFGLNPGPFNAKEHMFITIMANVTFGGAIGVYSTDIIFVQRMQQFFNQNELGRKAGYQILLTLSTQLIGFCMAGFTRRFLVYPPAMIWPSNLATIALNRSFHDDKNPVANGWRISRLKFFLVVFLAYGLYFVFPDCIMSFLTYFNWMTWIAPNNVKLALITGSISGMGLNPITTFDWSYISALNNPLVTPFFATMNVVGGAMLLGFPVILAVYFTNTWYTGYLPINSNHLFDNTGSRFNVSRIINSDFTLNVQEYENYSPAYQTAGNAVVFFFFFAIYTATAVHAGLYYKKEIMNGFRAVFQRRNARDAYNDVHNRLMRAYKEVPEWWFISLFVLNLVFGIVANEVYKTQMPIWAIFFCIGLGIIFIVPIGIITAITNVEVTLNVITEVVAGYAIPGRPLAVMIWKTYGVVSTGQAIGYVSDMKLGHYMRIAPRTVFSGQLVASIIACFVGIGVADWQIVNIDDLCGAANVNGFTCPGYNTFFNSAIQWGTLGPARLYSHGRIYYPLVFGFLVGAIVPIIPWLLQRRFPGSAFKFINTPALMYGPLNFAPYNLSYLIPGVYMAFAFQFWIRTRYQAWWAKYNYVLATALTSAISIFGVIWFFAILYNNYEPVWWGNNVPFEGCDGSGCPLLEIPDAGFFGPGPGQFH